MANKIIFALIGVIFGGIVGGIVVGTSCVKTYKKQIEELRAENDELRKKRRREKARELSEREEKARKAETEVDASLLTQLAMAREETRKTAELVKEHGYSEEEDESYDLDEDVEFDDPFNDEDGESVVVKKPREEKVPSFSMLSLEQYEEDFTFRDVEHLTYYQEDHVLADDFDDPVSNAVDIVGEEALKQAEETTEDFLYVLDEVEDTMYEIEINHEESYYRDAVKG